MRGVEGSKNDLRSCYRNDRRIEVDNQGESWRTDQKGGRKRGGDFGLSGAGFFNGFLSRGEVVVKRPFYSHVRYRSVILDILPFTLIGMVDGTWIKHCFSEVGLRYFSQNMCCG